MNIEAIKKFYSAEKEDVGEFACIKAKGMTIQIEKYRLDGFGSAASLTASGMFGLMKMETTVICPISVDMPLLSIDSVSVAGRQIFLAELYDTLLCERFAIPLLIELKSKLDTLSNYETGERWYDSIKMTESIAKKGKAKDKKLLGEYGQEFLNEFLVFSKDAKDCEPTEKKRKTAEYVDGLLSKGGPSTDTFIKLIGEKETCELFKKVIFATE